MSEHWPDKDALIRKVGYLEAENARLRAGIEALTPMGSEYVNDPEHGLGSESTSLDQRQGRSRRPAPTKIAYWGESASNER